MTPYVMWTPPKVVGQWCIGGPGCFAVTAFTRPNWLHRTMARLLLGWVWEDAK